MPTKQSQDTNIGIKNNVLILNNFYKKYLASLVNPAIENDILSKYCLCEIIDSLSFNNRKNKLCIDDNKT